MKIGILSMQHVDNMGSVLQAYGLKRTVEKFGNEVEFIGITRNDADYELLGNYKQEFCGEWEKKGFIGKFKKIDRYAFNRLKIKRKSIQQGT